MTQNPQPSTVHDAPLRGDLELSWPARGVLALLALGAAAIHFASVVPHLDEDWTHGVFFALVAWAQLLWGVAVLVRPSRTVLRIGALGSLAVVLVWVSSRTVGV